MTELSTEPMAETPLAPTAPPQADSAPALAEVAVEHTAGGWPVVPIAMTGANSTVTALAAAALAGGPIAAAVAATGACVLGVAAATRNHRAHRKHATGSTNRAANPAAAGQAAERAVRTARPPAEVADDPRSTRVAAPRAPVPPEACRTSARTPAIGQGRPPVTPRGSRLGSMARGVRDRSRRCGRRPGSQPRRGRRVGLRRLGRGVPWRMPVVVPNRQHGRHRWLVRGRSAGPWARPRAGSVRPRAR